MEYIAMLTTLSCLLMMSFVCVDGKRCLRNHDIGWREGNVYTCDDVNVPACCEKDFTFTCCEETQVHTVREQFQLWGTVALFVLVIVILYVYYRWETGGTDPSPCCGCVSSNESNHERLHDEDYDSPEGSVQSEQPREISPREKPYIAFDRKPVF